MAIPTNSTSRSPAGTAAIGTANVEAPASPATAPNTPLPAIPTSPSPAKRRLHSSTNAPLARVVQNHYPPKELQSPLEIPDFAATPTSSGLAVRSPIIIRPSGRPGFNAPRAATFFLGKDHERWRRYDRDRISGFLRWDRIASAVSSHGGDHRNSRGAFSSYSSGSEDEYSDSGTSYRSSRSRSSTGRSRRPSEAATPPMTPHDFTSGARPRRFSSNGPEAAFLRHETVIGIHTPRRRSSASSDAQPPLRPLAQIRPPSGQSSNVVIPPAGKAKKSNAAKGENSPEKKGKKSSGDRQRPKDSQKRKKSEPQHETTDLDESARPSLRRLRSNLEEAAAAAAASTEEIPALDAEEDVEQAVDLHATLSDAALDGKGPLSATDLQGLLPSSSDLVSRPPLARTVSPRALPLKLAKRQRPELVEGTLYDKSGPYREGAVTDGLSVRLFSSAEPDRTSSFEDSDLSNSEHPVTKPWGRRGSHSSFEDEDAVYVETRSRRGKSLDGNQHRPSPGSSFGESSANESDPMAQPPASNVYLITTPDNRVSSAAKLRRWAMDSQGNFYAAMEIKSIEAKLRAADPTVGKATRELAKELKETYLEDILDEVQKAQTLNPTRTGAVAKVLKTEDNRYVRLEEDYPEEAFFVIAGCEEDELYGVILNIFNQAIATLARFHGQGWMHGDVKLENLMFDENGSLVVIDYENANPYRGIPGGDGQVQLVSYDWVPPEATLGPHGRRMGPSGDLWALGCNLIRAFALRDGIEDMAIREVLLESGQKSFLDFIKKLTKKKQKSGSIDLTDATDYLSAKNTTTKASKGGSDGMPWDIFAYQLDMEPILNNPADEEHSNHPPRCVHNQAQIAMEQQYNQQPSTSPSSAASLDASGNGEKLHDTSLCDSCSSSTSYSEAGTAFTRETSIEPSSGAATPHECSREGSDAGPLAQQVPTPSRLLYRFARSAPELLTWVLTRCVVESLPQRSIQEAEQEGLRLADWFEKNHQDLLQKGRQAVDTAIEMSGSVWVRPRLDDARKSLGLD